MKNLSAAQILKLSPSERILLVQDIWDSIAAFPRSLQLTPAQKEELDRRLTAHHKNPRGGSPWERVKTGLLGKSR